MLHEVYGVSDQAFQAGNTLMTPVMREKGGSIFKSWRLI